MMRRPPSLLFRALLLAALALPLTSCRAGPDREARAEIFAAARQAQPAGHEHFFQHCSSCHGLEAGGGVGPQLVANPRVRDEDYVRAVTTSGRRTMPGFAGVLSDEELGELSRFVTALGSAEPGNRE